MFGLIHENCPIHRPSPYRLMAVAFCSGPMIWKWGIPPNDNFKRKNGFFSMRFRGTEFSDKPMVSSIYPTNGSPTEKMVSDKSNEFTHHVSHDIPYLTGNMVSLVSQSSFSKIKNGNVSNLSRPSGSPVSKAWPLPRLLGSFPEVILPCV
jgi:hypothetical protein